jgi:hypothetical protein
VSSPEQAWRVAQLGREAVKLEVLIQVDVKFGRTWGDAKYTWQELHSSKQRPIIPATQPVTNAPITQINGEPAPAEIDGNESGVGGDNEQHVIESAATAAKAEPPHVCIHCHQEPPDGSERRSSYNGAWLHPRCVEAFIRARMAEEGIPWDNPNRSQRHVPLTPPPPSPASPTDRDTNSDAPSTAINIEHAPQAINNTLILQPIETAIMATAGDESPWRAIPLAALINEPLRNGKILCPYHDDHRPSMHIYADHFYCFTCHAHGDHIDWLRDVEGLSYQDAIEFLRNYQGPLTQPESNIDTRTLNLARELWQEAQPIARTLAVRYLAEARGIDVNLLPANSETVLRFHPSCPFGPGGGRKPCLLALYRDVETNAGAGIHRTALTPEALAGGKVERLTLGRWPKSRAIKLWPEAKTLFVGEGLETTLAAATRQIYRDAPMRPAWAAASSNHLAQLPPVTGVEELVILVDHDPAGKESADACRRTWKVAGRKVTRLLPPSGKDFNDIVLEELRGSP